MAMETTEKGHKKMAYKIIHVMDHYEVYIDGKFICSEDKWTDAVREAEEYLAERR